MQVLKKTGAFYLKLVPFQKNWCFSGATGAYFFLYLCNNMGYICILIHDYSIEYGELELVIKAMSLAYFV